MLQYNLIPFRDLARGMDQRSAESNIADGYAEDLQDCITVSAGQLAKRPGYQQFAGYVPWRVSEVSHDGFQITMKLVGGVDLSAMPSSPIVVHGKLPQTEDGDYTLTDVTRYYSGFSADIRNVFTTTVNTVTITSADHDITDSNIMVWTFESLSDSKFTNVNHMPDSVKVNTSGTVVVTYTPPDSEQVYIACVDDDSSFVADYSGNPIVPVANVVTGSIPTSVHNLGSFNFIIKFYTVSGSEFTEFVPDVVSFNDVTGDISFSFASTVNFDGKVIVKAMSPLNVQEQALPQSDSITFVLTNPETFFPTTSVWTLTGSTWTMVLPDSVTTYDDVTDEVHIVVSNSELVNYTCKLIYGYARINANLLRVVDTQGIDTNYSGDKIANPQLTIWGLDHDGNYNDGLGGRVTHLDSYKRDAEERLICGLGGNLYAARSRDELGYLYQLPSFQVDMDARVFADASMAPLFQPSGTSPAIRTRGIVTGDDVTNDGAIVSGATYIGPGVADYTISLVSKVGSLALDSQVATSDYLTVSGLAHPCHEGTFQIIDIVVDGTDEVVIRVANENFYSNAFDEVNAHGLANVFTDQVELYTAPNYVPGDEIIADSYGLTSKVVSANGVILTIDGVTEPAVLSAGLLIFGKRTGSVHSFRLGTTPSVQNLVRGDMVVVDDMLRHVRVANINPFHDMSVEVVTDGTRATVTLTNPVTIVDSIDTATNKFITASPHSLTTNDPISLLSTGTLPGGLRAGSVFYALKTGADEFQLAATPNGSPLDLADDGSGIISALKVHGYHEGTRGILARTALEGLDGEFLVESVLDSQTFTFLSSAEPDTVTGVIVGHTVQFDESLTMMDGIANATTITVSDRWIPVEAPVSSGNLPDSTHVTYFSDSASIQRSTVTAGNMYFTSSTDELMKFDGTSIYRAGLFRWQPQLFAQVDTFVPSLAIDNVGGTVGSKSVNKFVLGPGEAIQFPVGSRVLHSQDNKYYVVKAVDILNNAVFVTSAISGTASGSLTLIRSFKYYFRLNAIDENNNIIASAVTGMNDFQVELLSAGQIHMRLVGMPAWDIYDYDKIELEVYRAQSNTAGPFYRLRVLPISFNNGEGYIDIYDGTEDFDLVQAGDLDQTMTALLGAELGTTWEQPPRAKYLTAVSNRLILANIKDYPQLDIVLRKKANATRVEIADFAGVKFTFRRDRTDAGTVTNMVDRAVYEFVSSGQVTFDPADDMVCDADGFTITSAAHGLAVGDWFYTFHSAAGVDKSLRFAGWYQVAERTTDTFTAKMPNAFTLNGYEINRFVCAANKKNIPVWLGTDGNFNTTYGNTTGSYEAIAIYRLASAINASMVMTNVELTGQTTFSPWLTANAGSEYKPGQLIVRQPKTIATALEVQLSAAPAACDVYINNYLRTGLLKVAANSLIYPSRVVISYENHPEIFDSPMAALAEESDSIVDINSADGQEITAIIPFFGESAFSSSQQESLVVVFKTNSIYLLDVKTRQAQRIESQGLGCTVPFSVCPTRAGIMFANLSGIYRLNSNLKITYVGKFIERYWRDVVSTANLALATGHNYAVGRQYKLSVPVNGDSFNTAVLVYDHTREGEDQEYGAWSRFTNHLATAWANLGDDSFFATTRGRVFKVRTSNDFSDYRDDDQPITMSVMLKAMDAGLPGSRKVARSIVTHMRMDKSNVTNTQIEAAVNLSNEFESCGIAQASTLGQVKVETFRASLPTPKFVQLQLKYTNGVKDENFELAGVDLYLAALTVLGVQERSEMK